MTGAASQQKRGKDGVAQRVVFDQMGGPEVLRIVEEADPVPGAGEALVDLRSIGLNRADVAFRSGKYLIQPSLPCGLGVEGAGVVADIGPDVEGFAVGDRVCILPAFPQGGRYASYVTRGVFPAHSLMPVPDGLDDIGASAFGVAYLTAWGGMVEIGGLKAGDFVLISAASSSVGLAAIRVAKLVGAVPVAVTRTSAKIPALREAGADHAIASAECDLGAALRDIVGSAGLNLVFDPVAGPFVESLIPFMAEEGKMVIYGGLSDQPTMFDRRPMLARGLSMIGYTVGQILKHADRRARGLAFLEDGIAKGVVQPAIDRVFPFAEVAAAHRHMEANSHVGKIVLSVP